MLRTQDAAPTPKELFASPPVADVVMKASPAASESGEDLVCFFLLRTKQRIFFKIIITIALLVPWRW